MLPALPSTWSLTAPPRPAPPRYPPGQSLRHRPRRRGRLRNEALVHVRQAAIAECCPLDHLHLRKLLRSDGDRGG